MTAEEGRSAAAAAFAARERRAALIASAEFVLRLRTRGIRDVAVLRALETVPRQAFVPHRYADLAGRDVALPIGCGQTIPDPFFLAHAIEALGLHPAHRVLEIGTGSGYGTAVLARLAGHVRSLERFQSLVVEAGARLRERQVANAVVEWSDGLDLVAAPGSFDRIIVDSRVETVPAGWLAALAHDGVLVVAIAAPGDAGREGRPRQSLTRIARDATGRWVERTIIASRLQPLLAGLSLGL